MTKSIFVSYSSKDFNAADLIRTALEAEGISCWIAPRDLTAGMQWGAGIVEAIEACDAVVVVFSQACNASPQVAREMELAVANRKPLIPVRIADDMPTDDMKYFLGVSHWFNAFEQPLESYLAQIVASVRSVLARQSSPWNSLQRRLPRSRSLQFVLVGGGMAALVLLAMAAMRPDPMAGMKSPLAGRWEARIAGGKPGQPPCILDVQKLGQATFSEDCPPPLTAAAGSLTTSKDGIWASSSYKPGDEGSFLLQGGTAHGFAAAFQRGMFGGLTTRDPRFGDVKWRRVSAGKLLTSAADKVLPNTAAWPLKDVPAIAARAQTYVRAKWKGDAVLTAIDIKRVRTNETATGNLHSPQGEIAITFSFYSPDTQEGLAFTPGSSAGAMFPMGVINHDRFDKLPPNFLDLPQAVDQMRAQGMRAKDIYQAQIENWAPGTTYGRAKLNGLAWMIDSQLDERFVVPAEVP